MPLTTKTFAELFTYTRGTGATRVNSAGRIVGVDFSSTSNTIGTGSKTFTITADLAIDRDWPVGSAIRAVDQVGGGTMNGTVTSYTASTQELVINVASITGSGTSTNWRIGSLEFRRDFDPVTLAPKGGLIEGGGTNLVFPNAIATTQTRAVISGETYTLSFYGTGTVTLTGAATGATVGTGAFPAAITSRTFVATTASLTLTVTGTVNDWQLELGSVATSRIPTTTVSVSRAADQLSVGGTNFNQFYNSTQGTLVFEATPIASAVGAVLGSLNDGTLNNAIRIQQKQSGTLSSIRKMATDGVTDVMAISASTGNTLRSNGVDYIETPDQSGAVKLGVASSGVANFLSVGAAENFRNTTDSGLTYNARTIGGTFGGAHFGIGRFVLAGSTSVINGATVGSVIVSTDGLALRRVNIPGLTQNLNEITSNGTNQYVAVGIGGVIYTSPDAENWTAQTSGTANTLNACAFGAGTFVAVGNSNTGRYSADSGVTWNTVTGLTGTLSDIVWTGSQFVAVNTIGGVLTSTDGITFAAVSTTGISPAFTNAQGITFGSGYYVIVGNGGQVAVCTAAAGASPATWVTYTNGGTPSTGTTAQLNEVLGFGTKFYLVGATQTVVEFDPVAVTFTSRTANVSSTLNGIATNGTRLLICGGSGAITTSDDGTTFTSRTGNAAQLNGAAFGNGTYVVVGNAINGSGLIATVNPTTLEYQRRVSNSTGNFNSVRFLNGAFFGCSTGMFRSTDGITWASAGTSTLTMLDVAFGNGVYISTRNAGGGVFVSADGVSFNNQTAITGFPGSIINGIGFGNGVFVVVGSQGGIATSSDNGTTWTLRTSGVTSTLHSVMFSTRDNQWYAAGDNGVILRSADAITWENIANDAAGSVIAGGIVQSNPFLSNLIVGATNKIAMRIKANDFAVSVNGADAVTDTSGSLPAPNQFSIGMNGVSGQHLNAHIRKITYFPITKTDAELKGLST